MAEALVKVAAEYGALSSSAIRRSSGRAVKRALRRLVDSKSAQDRPPAEHYAALIASSIKLFDTRIERTSSASLGWLIAAAAANDSYLGGIALNQATTQRLLELGIVEPGLMSHLILAIERNVSADPEILHALANLAVANGHLEQLIAVLSDMRRAAVKPQIAVIDHFVRLAASSNMCRAALEVAESFESVGGEQRNRLQPDTWYALLLGSAYSAFSPGVHAALPKVAAANKQWLDEGLLLSILQTAARTGQTDLAHQVLDLLVAQTMLPQEQHLVALLELYVRAGDVQKALRFANSLRTRQMTLSDAGFRPLIDGLKTPEAIDEAMATLEAMQAECQVLDHRLLFTIIAASERLSDLPRARAALLLGRSLGIPPDIKAYNVVLSACLPDQNEVLGESMLQEMQSLGLSPDQATLETMISVYVACGQYEKAYPLLERIKAEKWTPTASPYRLLYGACVDARDSRWRAVLEEARELGYQMLRPP